jgi:hypothetical protein
MGFAGKYDLASDNYTYVPFCAVRLVPAVLIGGSATITNNR